MVLVHGIELFRIVDSNHGDITALILAILYCNNVRHLIAQLYTPRISRLGNAEMEDLKDVMVRVKERELRYSLH